MQPRRRAAGASSARYGLLIIRLISAMIRVKYKQAAGAPPGAGRLQAAIVPGSIVIWLGGAGIPVYLYVVK